MCWLEIRLRNRKKGVLMSTPSPEKDTLFGPTVHEKIAYQILKKVFFFGTHFTTLIIYFYLKGEAKKTSFFKILICNFLLNRWSQEAVLLRTWSTNEYSKSWEGQPLVTNGSQENWISKFWKKRFFLPHPLFWNMIVY